MLTSLPPDSSLKQPVTCIASVCVQFALLAVLCCIPSVQMSRPSIRHTAVRSLATPIYFQRDPVAIPDTPALADSHPEPKPPSEVESSAEQEVNTQAETSGDSSDKNEEQELAPFPSWRMNSMPNGFTMMGHQIKTALAVFTPDPPILHGEVPASARGKDVVLDVVIDDQGSIVQVEVLQGVGDGVEESIVQTLRRWIFVPAKVNGVAIASRRQLRFHFPG